MSQAETNPEAAKKLEEAIARRDALVASLRAMNGHDPNLYASMGSNEGYDSLLCALRSQEAIIEDLRRSEDPDANP